MAVFSPSQYDDFIFFILSSTLLKSCIDASIIHSIAAPFSKLLMDIPLRMGFRVSLICLCV